MATGLTHRRTHNLLLISKLLNQRDNASPFTLVLDSIEQTAKPLLFEYIRRAKISKTQTIFLAFEHSKAVKSVDAFIPCFGRAPPEIVQEVDAVLTSANHTNNRFLLVIDSLWMLSTYAQDRRNNFDLTQFLTSLLGPRKQDPMVHMSLVAVYHTDVPVDHSASPYMPKTLASLSYLATTIIIVHSLPILLAEKAARERSLAAPAFGLGEETEGVLIGLKRKAESIRPEYQGLVLEMEHRRKSGRGVLEWYFLPDEKATTTAQPFREHVILLDDHPLFEHHATENMSEEDLQGMTFELGLTDRQKQEREGVVLPYFDAQQAGGSSTQGGRILYDMGVEDDFDEEEDEI